MKKNREMPTLPPQAKRHMGMKAANTVSNVFIYIFLSVIIVIWLFPFVCILLQSFETAVKCMSGNVIPKKFGLDNYKALFSGDTNFLKWYLNTFIIAVCVAVGQTVIQLCMSYTLSRFRFRMRKMLMQLMLILGMFPGMLGMIILYNVLKDLNLTHANAVPGLILVSIASSGMGYYVSKGFFDTIPKSLDEAARIDGATRMQIIRHITIPSILPTYFVLVMLSLANFLSNGMEQYFVFQNSFNKESIQVLDLYVYNIGMGSGGYSLATAISILKSVVSVSILFVTNKISKMTRGEGFI